MATMFICILFLTTAMSGSVEAKCEQDEALGCEGNELLPDHPLGLLSPADVDPLCRVVYTLERCLDDSVGSCSDLETIGWRSSLMSAKYICGHKEDYLASLDCYFKTDVAEAIETCADELQDNMDDMACMSFNVFNNCTVDSIAQLCSSKAVSTIRPILELNSVPKLKALGCGVDTTIQAQSTTITTTTKTSTTTTRPTPPPTPTVKFSTEVTTVNKPKESEDEDKETNTGGTGRGTGSRNTPDNTILNVMILTMTVVFYCR